MLPVRVWSSLYIICSGSVTLGDNVLLVLNWSTSVILLVIKTSVKQTKGENKVGFFSIIIGPLYNICVSELTDRNVGFRTPDLISQNKISFSNQPLSRTLKFWHMGQLDLPWFEPLYTPSSIWASEKLGDLPVNDVTFTNAVLRSVAASIESNRIY